MPTELEAIQKAFERAGWRQCSPRASGVLKAVFKTSYATVGILLADGVDEALNTWEDAQEELRELRSSDAAVRDTDTYLLIMVPHIDVQADSLREALSNAHVCRKVCVEVDGRTVEEALEALPFFYGYSGVDGTTIEDEIGTSSGDLSDIPFEDLRGRSADVVLDRLILGQYKR